MYKGTCLRIMGVLGVVAKYKSKKMAMRNNVSVIDRRKQNMDESLSFAVQHGILP